jgi:hypothetical protein
LEIPGNTVCGANFSKDVLGLEVTKIRKDEAVDALRADVEEVCGEMGIDVADESFRNNQVIGHLFFVEEAALTIVHNEKLGGIVSVSIAVAHDMCHMKGPHPCRFYTALVEKSAQFFEDVNVFEA